MIGEQKLKRKGRRQRSTNLGLEECDVKLLNKIRSKRCWLRRGEDVDLEEEKHQGGLEEELEVEFEKIELKEEL